ncbi:crystal protein-like [Erpetoichthys calabaricus]|uniref:crystal protein-like n=1 Tax=Erpetoichthys calabaricus TaxID=27687 RepID=UPI00223420C7|nr:crystal protein-like [Erpetoichthys calabaricus]
MSLSLRFVLILAACELGVSQTVDSLLVQTPLGLIKGVRTSHSQSFWGIPYADAPTGWRRWKPPQDLSPWHGIYDGTFPRPGCPQLCKQLVFACPKQISEDCLYLNVFVPLTASLTPAPKYSSLPVMVWIHGGNFRDGTGSALLYDGCFLANSTNTVVVTINYRLGALGFLVTGMNSSKDISGNLGFLDQQKALTWVQMNIASFGGDPRKVTLFGQSAGAQSVGLHLTVRSSESLFKQAIIHSLPFSLPLKTKKQATVIGIRFLKIAGCLFEDMKCMSSLTTEKILDAQIKADKEIHTPLSMLETFQPWGPVIDGEVIEEQTFNAFAKGMWQKHKPVMAGITSEEANLFVYELLSEPLSRGLYVAYLLAAFNIHTPLVLLRYPPQKGQDQRLLLSQVVSDYALTCPNRRAMRDMAESGASSWLYIFSQVASIASAWGNKTYCYQHACHGSDMPFLWNTCSLINLTFTSEERTLADSMACFWGNFAHYGQPNPQSSNIVIKRPASSRGDLSHSTNYSNKLPVCSKLNQSVYWPQYSLQNAWLFMNLTVNLNVTKEFRKKFCTFWDAFVPY